MKSKLLLIDFNNLLYRAVFGNKTLSHKGKFTGGIYGVINMVSSIVNRYEVDRVVVCKDTKPYIRSTHYQQYKQGRRQGMDEDAIKQVSIARKQFTDLIRTFSLPVARSIGHEADDLIGRYCRHKHKRFDRILIMSNDSDFYQLLLQPNIFLARTAGLYGRAQFDREFIQLSPDEWPRIMALKGSHNGVPGIKGVGDKIALKLVMNGITDEEIEKKYKHSPEEIKLRTALARFPFPLAPRPMLPKTKPIVYDALKFEEVCMKYGIRFRTEFHNAFLRLAQ